MWSTHLTVKHHALWGTYVNDLDAEASTVINGDGFAAVLDCMGLIKVSGEEAESFLQGQVTCDIAQVRQGKPQLGAHCNVKGRAQATFACLYHNDAFYLALPADQVEPTVQALSKFALFSKATLAACHEYELMGFGGKQAIPTLSQAFAINLQAQSVALADNDSLFASLPHLGVFGLIPGPQATATANALGESGLALCGDNAWLLSQINSGVTHIRAPQAEQWIPQEINYDLIGGVSFKKGCYKGQEIIARIHYRGQTKVRTFPLQISGCETCQIGDKVSNDSGSGTLVSIARVSERTLRVLSTLKIEQSESESLKLDANEEAQIRVLLPPYAIT
jgi:folate-binding protein YgfZ